MFVQKYLGFLTTPEQKQADLKILEEKPDLEKAIAELEASSRGWFEEEADFMDMCKFEEKEAKGKYALKVKAKQQQQKKCSCK